MDELDAPANEWRNQVRDMSYDIEDCIDNFMRHFGKNDTTNGFAKKAAKLLKKLRERHQIASKIQEIKICLEEVNKRRMRYRLDDCTSKHSYVPVDPRVVAIYVEAAGLVGIDIPTHELTALLMGEEQELRVAAIVGFGGLGKTTLANQAYHKLEGQFECRAFVSVSRKPDIPKLLNKILIKIGGCVSHASELDDLLKKITEQLQDKRKEVASLEDEFRSMKALLERLADMDELDPQAKEWRNQVKDISHDIEDCVDDFMHHLGKNNNHATTGFLKKTARLLKKVRIQYQIATKIQDIKVRVKEVSEWRMRCKDYVYQMKYLDDNDSRRLFFGRIFGFQEPCPDIFNEVSADILKKCGGLPLAIISIASLLTDQPKTKWEYVRNSLGFMFGGNSSLKAMERILDLSYRNLPHHLKTRLLYLAMYPEDYIIQKNDLLMQWIAEGFVISKVRGLDAEDVAANYFNELINTSMIQPVDTDYNDEVLSCRVHDLLLDLIRLKSADENFIDMIDEPQATTGLHKKTRRVSLHYDGAGDEFADQIGSLKSLRTFDVSRSSLDSVRSLGELTNLRDLQIFCSSYPIRHVVEEALRSSLERFSCSSSLNKLVLSVPRFPCTLFGHEWSILSGFSAHLRSLNLKEMLFSSVPKWIAQLHGLYDLELWVREVVPKDDEIGGK
ncbi:hypothetical protein BAE44_0008959 [Dichanthelium oligosanthes]|uniref:Disease resistance protein RPM1 n=1 Tax=Dichanthelium oligosanthes TaxID=888268 RepID=A0A1E5VY47_9POAL|nr:hypothetical protein BAE44_0008959 [Dichanthelium oligosanthes]